MRFVCCHEEDSDNEEEARDRLEPSAVYSLHTTRTQKQLHAGADLLQPIPAFGSGLSRLFNTFKRGSQRSSIGGAKQIAILVVGTRGDVQPFLGIGLELKKLGHRVRIASHKEYRSFVTSYGLEFYPLGGDPRVLSEFVVKHR